MSLTEQLIQAVLSSPDDRKDAALRILKGEPTPSPVEPGPEPFVTLPVCAKRLGISECSLWRYGVPSHELGGRAKFRVGEVEKYLTSPEFKAKAAALKAERRRALTNSQNHKTKSGRKQSDAKNSATNKTASAAR